ncbi:uncharacterized protein LOC142355042 [Convolutriloba macropyga]|uniref:uncharacterized protein LOC142355042 n=1 Tax=Convolutriloba macropyga TaxID=536237 RepID=UPI003F52403F
MNLFLTLVVAIVHCNYRAEAETSRWLRFIIETGDEDDAGTTENIYVEFRNNDDNYELINGARGSFNRDFRAGQNNTVDYLFEHVVQYGELVLDDFKIGFGKYKLWTAKDAWKLNRLWIQDGTSTTYYTYNNWITFDNTWVKPTPRSTYVELAEWPKNCPSSFVSVPGISDKCFWYTSWDKHYSLTYEKAEKTCGTSGSRKVLQFRSDEELEKIEKHFYMKTDSNDWGLHYWLGNNHFGGRCACKFPGAETYVQCNCGDGIEVICEATP